MYNIVVFFEPPCTPYSTPLKIGNLFLNRVVIDEDASFEIVKIFELAKDNKGYDVLSVVTDDRTAKEKHDRDVIETGIKFVADLEDETLMPHFVFLGNSVVHYLTRALFFFWDVLYDSLDKYGIKSSVLTILAMERKKLVTEEYIKTHFDKKEKRRKYKPRFAYMSDFLTPISIYDSIEGCYINLRNQDLYLSEIVNASPSVFIKKLTEEELSLVEEVNTQYLTTFQEYHQPSLPKSRTEWEARAELRSCPEFAYYQCSKLSVPFPPRDRGET